MKSPTSPSAIILRSKPCCKQNALQTARGEIRRHGEVLQRSSETRDVACPRSWATWRPSPTSPMPTTILKNINPRPIAFQNFCDLRLTSLIAHGARSQQDEANSEFLGFAGDLRKKCTQNVTLLMAARGMVDLPTRPLDL